MEDICLKNNFIYFLQHQDKLVKKYNGKFIVIKNQKVIGSYESNIEAYNNALKTEKIGTFIIQYCVAGSIAYTHTFHSPCLVYIQ